MQSNIILLNKPFAVLSQFSDQGGRKNLAEFIPAKFNKFYPAGRLDYDSEGLLLLTNNGKIQQRISHPKFKLVKTYWVQVEGEAKPAALEQLRSGVNLRDGVARAKRVAPFNPENKLWPRTPPIRQRKHITTSWLMLSLSEGRNRQVRRMTASVGLPTLRLIRYAIGHWTIDNIAPGEFVTDTIHLPE